MISDGDISGALLVSKPEYQVDIFLGIGGGPEGVLAASALDTHDCHFQGRFIFDRDEDIKVAKKMGINDLNRKYELNEIVKGDSIFCATAITDCMPNNTIKGVIKKNKNSFLTETIFTHKSLDNKGVIKKEIIFNDIKK